MEYSLSGCAPINYPTETLFALLYGANGDTIAMPKEVPFMSEWGCSNSILCALEADLSMPVKIDMIWLSILERKFYSLEKNIRGEYITQLLEKSEEDKTIIIGMAPYGQIALWVNDTSKSYIVDWLQADEIVISMEDFLQGSCAMSLENYCEAVIHSVNLKNYSLPPRNLFDKYMQQFTYRYIPLFEKWVDKDDEKWRKYDEDDKVIPEFEYIEEALYDGTHDKLHDDGLLKYHEAGKPKKLTVKWHVKKSEYTAYFWFEDKEICAIFDKFYGAHRDTKMDFIVHIDPEKNKYELALYRYGLKKPQVITESAYQLIVFKSKFECYRSENYNQPKGAWIW